MGKTFLDLSFQGDADMLFWETGRSRDPGYFQRRGDSDPSEGLLEEAVAPKRRRIIAALFRRPRAVC